MSEKTGSRSGGLRALLRFLLGYAFVLLALFQLLPAAGRYLEARYDALDGPDKLVLAAVTIVLIAAWQGLGRMRRAR